MFQPDLSQASKSALLSRLLCVVSTKNNGREDSNGDFHLPHDDALCTRLACISVGSSPRPHALALSFRDSGPGKRLGTVADRKNSMSVAKSSQVGLRYEFSMIALPAFGGESAMRWNSLVALVMLTRESLPLMRKATRKN